MTGPVEIFADIHPDRISLIGKAGSPLSGQVAIVPRADLPFSITRVTVRSGAHIRYRLDTLEKDGRTGYRLLVENTKPDKGRYVDTVTLETDSPIRPKISIPVIGNISDALPQKRTS
jgi:hypothetical protein